MADQQGTKYADIFASLAAPFSDDEVRQRQQGGRTLHYVTASVVANRLDDVLGPEGWEFELKAWDANSLFGILTIKLPDGTVVRKMNVGGAADMPEDDNSAKSAASDCLKRCAAMVGVARYLYQSGWPRFAAPAFEGFRGHASNGGGYQGGGSGYQQQAPPPRQDSRQQAPPQPQRNSNGGSTPDGCPADGRGLFKWAKSREESGAPGGQDLLKNINGIIKQRFGNLRTVDLSPDQTAEVWAVIAGSANGGGQQRRQAPPAPSRDYNPADPRSEEDVPF